MSWVPHSSTGESIRAAGAEALRGLLNEIGYADALIARELPDGKLMLIDGHLRAETTPEAVVPVLILDITEEEGEKLLVTLDPLASMAETDSKRITALLKNVRTDSSAVTELLRRTAGNRIWEILHPQAHREAETSELADQLMEKWHTRRISSGVGAHHSSAMRRLQH